MSASPLGERTDVLVEREAWVMGTRLRVVVESSTERAALGDAERVITEVERLDDLLSTWKPEAEIARANHGRPGKSVSLSDELHGLLSEAFTWAEATGRAFHPAIGPYIDAWDIRGAGRVPPAGSLREAADAARLHMWRLGDTVPEVERGHTSAWIDTGGFGKGAALRSAAVRLDEAGEASSRLLADLGGQVWARAPKNRPWRVGVAHPLERGEPAAWLSLHDVSAATSGTSERFVEVGDAHYGHIIDPRSGRPAPPWGTVTVVHPDPMVADVLATALYVMGPEEGLRWLEDRPEIAALFLDVRGNGLRSQWTESMEPWLDHNPEYSP